MPYVSLRIPRRHYERLVRRAAADEMSLDEWLSLAIRNDYLLRKVRAARARLAKG